MVQNVEKSKIEVAGASSFYWRLRNTVSENDQFLLLTKVADAITGIVT
jgi:hypothetical protein